MGVDEEREVGLRHVGSSHCFLSSREAGSSVRFDLTRLAYHPAMAPIAHPLALS